METINHLYKQLRNPHIIAQGIRNASIGKANRPEVREVLDNISMYIGIFRSMVASGNLDLPTHNAVYIKDGINAKPRLVVQPDFFPEQVLHHVFVLILTPMFRKSMYYYSCGSLPNKGGLFGKKYLAKYIRQHQTECRYVLKADVHHFFQTISPTVVKNELSKKIKDKRFLSLLFQVLDSNKAIYKGEYINMGLPIGYYLSQWIANWMLTKLDHMIKEVLRVKCYVRYMDDIILIGTNKRALHRCMNAITTHLSKLNLSLKGNYQVYKFHYIKRDGSVIGRDIDFMGYRFWRNRVTLRRHIMLRISRKANHIHKLHVGKHELPTYKQCCSIVSYWGWIKHTNSHTFYFNYIMNKAPVGMCKHIIQDVGKQIWKKTKTEIHKSKGKEVNKHGTTTNTNVEKVRKSDKTKSIRYNVVRDYYILKKKHRRNSSRRVRK